MGGAESMGRDGSGRFNDDFWVTWYYPASAGGPVGNRLSYIVKDFTYTSPGSSAAAYVFWSTTFSEFTVTTP